VKALAWYKWPLVLLHRQVIFVVTEIKVIGSRRRFLFIQLDCQIFLPLAEKIVSFFAILSNIRACILKDFNLALHKYTYLGYRYKPGVKINTGPRCET
jgi:hypothetical protein